MQKVQKFFARHFVCVSLSVLKTTPRNSFRRMRIKRLSTILDVGSARRTFLRIHQPVDPRNTAALVRFERRKRFSIHQHRALLFFYTEFFLPDPLQYVRSVRSTCWCVLIPLYVERRTHYHYDTKFKIIFRPIKTHQNNFSILCAWADVKT